MAVYRIRQWNEVFENNRTRSVQTMSWVPMPNKMDGDGYTELLDHPNGAAHYGAWIAIVHVASKCHERGTLLRDSGQPHDSASLSRITRISPEVFDEAFPRLVSIGWLCCKECENNDLQSDVTPASGGRQQGAIETQASATIEKSTEQERTEEKKGSASDDATALEAELVDAWNSLEGVPSVRSVTRERRKHIRQRCRDPDWLESWRNAIRKIPDSDFLMGKTDGTWRATFDWFIKPQSVNRILEGQYDGKQPAKPGRDSGGYDPNAGPSKF